MRPQFYPVFDPIISGSENLINCWIREGGSHTVVRPGELCIPLISRPGKLQVSYADRTLLGDVRLKGNVRLNGQELDSVALADLLVSEMGSELKTSPGKKPDWKENIESSLSVFTALANRAAGEFEPKLDFISSEQSLQHGHRFHPSPKSRVGFSQQDLERYSPEWGGRFRLHYFGLKDDSAVLFGDPIAHEEWRAKTREAFGTGDLWVLPVHPWQARRALKLPEIQDAICSGSMIDLGEMDPEFTATASVRTLYQPGWDRFIKTSLDVRITNCFRRNTAREMETIAHVNRLIRLFPIERSTLRILPEPMSMDIDFKSSLHLGTIFRDGLSQERAEGIEPLLAGALFGDRQFSVERMRRVLVGPATSWFERYCEGLIPPILNAFFRFGMMFEPHLQNILVGIRDGRSVRFLLRDLDNVKIVEGSAADRALAGAPEGVRKEALYSEEHAWKRLIYCLVVNHLAEAIATLARVEAQGEDEILQVERQLWGVLFDVLCHRCEPHPRLTELLESPVLWSKMNLHTRIQRTEDRVAPFATPINPLSFSKSELEAAV